MMDFGKTIVDTIFLVFYGVYTFVEVLVCKIIPNSKKSLDGEVFLITGSASGIGRQVALHLAEHHNKTTLVLWDCSDDPETAESVKSLGAKVFSYKVDVTNQIEVSETAKQVAKDVRDVTILFNNAGIAGIADLLSYSPERIEKTIQVNLLSHFWTLKAFLPSMILKNHGHIVTTCSVMGWWGLRNDVPYAASKFAIRGYIESLRSEVRNHPLKPKNIKFTTVFPTFVRTPLIEKAEVKTRFPYFSKYLETQYVAENIVDSICKNQETLFLPKYIELSLRFKSLLPQKLMDHFSDYFFQQIILKEGNLMDENKD